MKNHHCSYLESLQLQGTDLLLLLRSLCTDICRATTQQGSSSTWPSLFLPAYGRLTPRTHRVARSTQCSLTYQICPRSGSRHCLEPCRHACLVGKEAAEIDRGPFRQHAWLCQMCVGYIDAKYTGHMMQSRRAVQLPGRASNRCL